MTVKEYLSGPKALREEILCDLDNLAAMRSVVEDCTTHLSFTAGRNPSRNTDTFENVMLDIAAEEEKIEAKKQKLCEMVEEILGLILKLPDQKYQKVLRLRYIFYYDWKKVSEEMCIGEDYVFTLHRDALAAFEELMQEQEKKNSK